MNPALVFLFGFPATGMILFTLAVLTSNLRLFIRRERGEIHRLFGHAHRIYPPARPMQVRPSVRSNLAWAPLSECVWKESV